MRWKESVPSRRFGLTLIELLLAMTLFTLVIGTIFASLNGSVRVLETGKRTMEVYQNARAGLNRIAVDLRKSLSPASFPYEEEEEEFFEEDFYIESEDRNELQVTFRGSGSSVQFTIRQVRPRNDDEGLAMDVVEVEYKVADGNLVKEIKRSIIQARLNDKTERRRFESLGKRRDPGRYISDEQRGFLDNPAKQVVAEGVVGVKFSYSDGEEWFDDWDSTDVIVSEYSRELDLDELTQDDEELLGLPQMVNVKLEVKEKLILETTTQIPGRNLNMIGYRSQESNIATAFINRQGRRDWLRGGRSGGRGGGRGQFVPNYYTGRSRAGLSDSRRSGGSRSGSSRSGSTGGGGTTDSGHWPPGSRGENETSFR